MARSGTSPPNQISVYTRPACQCWDGCLVTRGSGRMPAAPKRPCAFPGCGELVTHGRCTAHTQKQERRGGSTERGYDYVWQQFRDWFIRRHPLCADCGIVATSDVHHVKKVRDYPELKRVEGNCLGLCHQCHAVRTARGE